jgi:UDP-3-O-[3-hydroxymyristoyl] glucosamine N-acyltransferase
MNTLSPVSATLGTIARHIGAILVGPEERLICGVAALRNASSDRLSFYSNRQYLKDLTNTGAGAVILKEQDKERCPTAMLLTDNPYLGYAQAARLLYPPFVPSPGIHPTVQLAFTARIGESTYIGPYVVIEENVIVGDNVYIESGCVIQSNTVIGENTRLEANVTICRNTNIGACNIIHPGAVIGADGFGLAYNGKQWVGIPQLGRVILGNNVEIGANTTIDRGSLEDTVIEDDVKLDNQIQVAHNVHIGAHTAIAGCTGIAGSTWIGCRCLIGGGVGIAGHLIIADDVHITGGSVVLQSITEPGVYSSGTPIQPNKLWHRNFIRIKQLDEMAGKLKSIVRQMSNRRN